MRPPIASMDTISTKKPAKIMAGKPTAKILRLGAARVTMPRPTLMKSKNTITGSAISKAPRNIMLLHCTTLPSITWLKIETPIGMV